ncbi:hypothetical protein CSW77_26815, partial [Shigella flexneri]
MSSTWYTWLEQGRDTNVSRQVLTAVARVLDSGLSREEVATLAGVSSTWYTWLEQGRDTNVSRQVLTAVARVLD